MPIMPLAAALDRVTNMALNWEHRSKNAVARTHGLLSDPKYAEHHPLLEIIFNLLITPSDLKNEDIKGAADYVYAQLIAGEPIDRSVLEGFKHFGAAIPPESVQQLVIAEEHIRAAGKYEHYLKDHAKKKAEDAEARAANDPEIKAAWESFYSRHTKWCKRRKVARRTVMKERNMEPEEFQATPDGFRQFELNGMSFRWVLWGFENGNALLQKLTVNITPFGVNIFIPRWWSFDYRRDLNWPAILEVLDLWGVAKQGEKFNLTQEYLDQKGPEVLKWYEQGQKEGKKGDDLKNYVIEGAKLNPAISDSSYYRLRRHGLALRKKND